MQSWMNACGQARIIARGLGNLERSYCHLGTELGGFNFCYGGYLVGHGGACIGVRPEPFSNASASGSRNANIDESSISQSSGDGFVARQAFEHAERDLGAVAIATTYGEGAHACPFDREWVRRTILPSCVAPVDHGVATKARYQIAKGEARCCAEPSVVAIAAVAPECKYLVGNVKK